MPRYVAFLRGINLGSRRPPMSQLKVLFEDLGFSDVATFIASGNVIFSTSAKGASKLETKIAKHLQAKLGYDVETFVRTAEQVIAVAGSKVYESEVAQGHSLHVAFLHEPLDAATARKLNQIRVESDEFKASGSEYYWLCRIKVNESEIWKHPDVKALKLPSSTMRNITSVRKLVAKHLTGL